LEILRNFLGNLSSGVIRLLVTVGILVAVYFLIVRPVLDKTSEITKETNESIQKSFKRGFGNSGAGLPDIDRTLKEVNEQVQRQIRQSLHVARAHGAGDPKRLLKCIERAGGDPHRITRCTAKF
jgi:predicted PurR-regulated permease PerM